MYNGANWYRTSTLRFFRPALRPRKLSPLNGIPPVSNFVYRAMHLHYPVPIVTSNLTLTTDSLRLNSKQL